MRGHDNFAFVNTSQSKLKVAWTRCLQKIQTRSASFDITALTLKMHLNIEMHLQTPQLIQSENKGLMVAKTAA